MVRKVQAGDYIIYGLMFIIMLITLYPFYNVFVVSLSSGTAVMQGKVVWYPVGVTLKTYEILFRDNSIISAYINTFKYTFFGVLLNLVMSIMCAYPLSRRDFTGRKFFSVMIVFTMYFSGGIIPLYLLVKKLYMIDTIWAIILPTAINTYNMILLRTFMAGIPDALHESARIDGADDFCILFRIVIPLSKAILATIALFYTVEHWNSFMPSLLYLNKKNMFPIQLLLRNMVLMGDLSDQKDALGGANDFLITETTIKYAAIMVTTLPILVVYPFVQKYFVKGVMIGSLKG